MTIAAGESRPLILVGYGPRCVPVVELTRAAGSLCDVTWLIDRSIPEMNEMSSFLDRFGTVIDINGLSASEIAVAASIPREPQGIVTLLDKGMVIFAEVAEILGLAFHSIDSARALTDKAYQRERLFASGLDSVHCQVLDAEEIAHGHVEAHPALGWPVVLKPRSSQGSHYTFLARDGEHLNALLRSIAADCPEMLIESYIPDDPARLGGSYASYVSVESVVNQGVIIHLAVTGRFPLAENFRETGFFIPAVLDPEDESGALELASAAIEALNVSTGSLHTEIKFTPGGPRVVEVNGRIGGGVPEMLMRAANVDFLEMTLENSLEMSLNVAGPVSTNVIGYRFFLQPPPVSAVVAHIEGLDHLSEYPGVDGISVHQRPGAQLDWKDGSRNHILSVVGSASDYDQLQTVSRILNEMVKVSYISIHHD